MQPISVIVIDDQVPNKILAALDASDEIIVLAYGTDSEQALELCQAFNPDIMLIDVSLNGVEVTRQVRKRCSGCRVLAVSTTLDKAAIQAMISAGATGYIFKDTFLSNIEHTLRTIRDGKAVFSAEVAQILIGTP